MSDLHANTDPREVEHFDALAHRWWDPEGELSTLHAINGPRVEFIASRLELDRATVLDVGCGGGLLAEALARRGARVTGIDLAPASIDVAREHARAGAMDVDYRVADVASLAAEGDTRYDAVACMELIEHVPDPARLIGDLAALTRPGGHLFVSTINRTARAYALAVVAAEYLLGLVPRGTHDYARFVRPSEIAAWGRAADLHLQEVVGLRYNPLTRRATLGDDPSVNYIARLSRPAPGRGPARSSRNG